MEVNVGAPNGASRSFNENDFVWACRGSCAYSIPSLVFHSSPLSIRSRILVVLDHVRQCRFPVPFCNFSQSLRICSRRICTISQFSQSTYLQKIFGRFVFSFPLKHPQAQLLCLSEKCKKIVVCKGHVECVDGKGCCGPSIDLIEMKRDTFGTKPEWGREEFPTLLQHLSCFLFIVCLC